MKSVVDFEKAKTTHTQTRVPARLTRGRQGADRREWPKAGLDRGASQCQPEKEQQEQGSRKAEQTRTNKVQRKPTGSKLRTNVSEYNKALELPQGRA